MSIRGMGYEGFHCMYGDSKSAMEGMGHYGSTNQELFRFKGVTERRYLFSLYSKRLSLTSGPRGTLQTLTTIVNANTETLAVSRKVSCLIWVCRITHSSSFSLTKGWERIHMHTSQEWPTTPTCRIPTILRIVRPQVDVTTS